MNHGRATTHRGLRNDPREKGSLKAKRAVIGRSRFAFEGDDHATNCSGTAIRPMLRKRAYGGQIS